MAGVNLAEGEKLGPGSRGVNTHIETLRALDREGLLTYVEMRRPDRERGLPRVYVVDYGDGEVGLTGRQIEAWAIGFRAGRIAAHKHASA